VLYQAFVDESFENDGIFVLGGCVATAESWANFSREWEKLLPSATIGKSGKYRFKMKEMAENDERMARVPAFFRVIEDHIVGFISATIDASEVRRARDRLFVPNAAIDWDRYRSPWYFAFLCLMDKFHAERAVLDELIPQDATVDFYFDERREKKSIIESWDDYLSLRPFRSNYGATPRFENDEDFLPLQAADFWAWWVRKWRIEGTPERIGKCDFGAFRKNPERKYFRMQTGIHSEMIVEVLKGALRLQVPRTHQIWEIKE
jgi:hypothetical protein